MILYTLQKDFSIVYYLFSFFPFREKKREVSVVVRRIGLSRNICFDRVPSIQMNALFISFSLFFSLYEKKGKDKQHGN